MKIANFQIRTYLKNKRKYIKAQILKKYFTVTKNEQGHWCETIDNKSLFFQYVYEYILL